MPYSDTNASGTLTFCDAQGQPLSHGNINDKPFAHLVVSSAPAEAPVAGLGRSATLFLAIPQKGVDPQAWLTNPLSGSSFYTNPAHPMVAAAAGTDYSLEDVLATDPVQWNGLVEVRMFTASFDGGILSTQYPAADLQVTGPTWTLLRGGTAPCNAGFAIPNDGRSPPTSAATVSPPPQAAPVAPASPGATSPASPSATPSPSAAPGVAAPTHAGTTTTGSAPQSAAGTPSGGSGSSVPLVFMAAGAVVAAGGVLVLLRLARHRKQGRRSVADAGVAP